MASQSQAACINDVLPDDILVRVASMLDEGFYKKAALRSFREVCKHWRSIGREATRRLPIDCPKDEQSVEEVLFRFLSVFPRVESLLFEHGYRQGQMSPSVTFKTITHCLDLSGTVIKHLHFDYGRSARVVQPRNPDFVAMLIFAHTASRNTSQRRASLFKRFLASHAEVSIMGVFNSPLALPN